MCEPFNVYVSDPLISKELYEFHHPRKCQLGLTHENVHLDLHPRECLLGISLAKMSNWTCTRENVYLTKFLKLELLGVIPGLMAAQSMDLGCVIPPFLSQINSAILIW